MSDSSSSGQISQSSVYAGPYNGMVNSSFFNYTFNNDDDKDKSLTKNRSSNASAEAQGDEWKGKIVCKGNPKLQGMTTVTIAQGGGGSGVWYIKECKQSYQTGRSGGAYLTELQLSRPSGSDDSDTGGGGVAPPSSRAGGGGR